MYIITTLQLGLRPSFSYESCYVRYCFFYMIIRAVMVKRRLRTNFFFFFFLRKFFMASLFTLSEFLPEIW